MLCKNKNKRLQNPLWCPFKQPATSATFLLMDAAQLHQVLYSGSEQHNYELWILAFAAADFNVKRSVGTSVAVLR